MRGCFERGPVKSARLRITPSDALERSDYGLSDTGLKHTQDGMPIARGQQALQLPQSVGCPSAALPFVAVTTCFRSNARLVDPDAAIERYEILRRRRLEQAALLSCHCRPC